MSTFAQGVKKNNTNIILAATGIVPNANTSSPNSG